MSNAYLSPLLNDAQFNDDGTFLAGGLIWFYEAGTSTPLLAYTTPVADTAWSNPIQLDQRGETGGEIWLKAGSSYKMILEGPPEYGQAHGVVISTFDNISGINDPGTTSVQNWVAFAGTPTYVSSTSFSVTSDYRTTFLTGRRVKMNNSDSTTYYGTVVSSAYATGVTNVTVSPDYGESVSSLISSVSCGFIETGAISSIPIAVNAGSAASGSQYQMWIDYDGTNLKWAKNADASSASWPINASTATAAQTNAFATQQTSLQGSLTARQSATNDVSLVNDATSWGLIEQSVGYALKYDRSTGLYSYGGFGLPAQTGISNWSSLPNGMIFQYGYATASNAGAVITFPTAFTNASSYAITIGTYGTGPTTHNKVVVQNTSNTTFTAYQANSDTFYWIAMGY
jgi:hypothetical protein